MRQELRVGFLVSICHSSTWLCVEDPLEIEYSEFKDVQKIVKQHTKNPQQQKDYFFLLCKFYGGKVILFPTCSEKPATMVLQWASSARYTHYLVQIILWSLQWESLFSPSKGAPAPILQWKILQACSLHYKSNDLACCIAAMQLGLMQRSQFIHCLWNAYIGKYWYIRKYTLLTVAKMNLGHTILLFRENI